MIKRVSKLVQSKWFEHNQHKTKYPYNQHGYYIVHDKVPAKNSKVTVVTPVFNAEKFIKKTIDSVLNQSLGIDNIQYILVDDKSTDSTRDILIDYSARFEQIIAVFLASNTGTPGKPRNIGIELCKSDYITFLDADDWLESTGLETLYQILEETGDDYVVGKTIQVENKKTKTIGEHESCKERRSVAPFSIPHICHHLGPRARMIRTSGIKNHHIRFPEMKFAEDKQFFIDVLIHSQSLSTTREPIYYLNRLNNAQTRLTNQTNIIHKTDCNLKVIDYILNKDLAMDKKKVILNRLYEFDSINRLFKTPHFEKTSLKPLYYRKFNQVLKTTKNLEYEFSEEFFQPTNKVAFTLLQNKQYKDLEALIGWDKNEKVKKVMIKENLPYTVVPLKEGNEQSIRLPMYAEAVRDFFEEDQYILQFKVYGDHIHDICDIFIQKWDDAHVEFSLPVKVDSEGTGYLVIDLIQLSGIPQGNYSIFLRYKDYMKVNIRKNEQTKLQQHFNGREFTFFQTGYSNVALKTH
ncbi:glycosyltransferase [Mesobacillus maritimus]|uniref:glycosyltransferase family 2 protein n=1 Tax=Mesobacillus maritimus TaxID=1643336 RepID=UPI00203E36E2|nr:glycosyltransferase family 2 protein [Mesobacillus maritimus]MCM3668112.1 glycosyltransferase [Mesobacillus maritimus]